MKRITKILPAFCIMFVALFFAGCAIEAPTVTYNGCLVSWNWVSNASSYEVEINGTSYTTTQNNYNLAPFIQEDLAIRTVKVKALTKNIFLRESAFSNAVTVSVGATRLPAPQNFAVNIENDSYLCSWDAVENADNYCIKVYNEDESVVRYFFTNATSYNLNGKIDVAGEFMASVFAYSNENSRTYAPSYYSNTSQKFVMNVSLSTPDAISFRSYGGKLYCEWKTIDGADSYNVSILNGETYNVQNNAASTLQMLELTEKGISVGNGETIFACVGAVGAENSGYSSSPYTDMRAYFGGGSKSDFATKTYDFVGQTFDLVADSYEELQNIIWFSLYYRVTNMKFFFNYEITGSTFSKDYEKCLNDYQEIKHISYRLVSNSDGSYTSSVDYIHPMYPTETASDSSVSSSQNQYVKPSYANTEPTRSSDFNDFGIEKRTKTAEVYNSDQLYYAVQSGCKPVFPDNSNPALVAYNKAKAILREIITNSMSDYEKVKAIFDWTCFNTHYDYALKNINAKISAKQMTGNISTYRGFYIEGVFFDNGQAVCDGMSKAFALLCGIEGIECCKVTGVSDTTSNTTNTPDHAWNKVKLDLDNDNEGEWYIVDVTQNDFISSNYVETLSHSFFLHTDNWAMHVGSKHKETSTLAGEANTAFDYYASTTYTHNGVTGDLLIESKDELNRLASYAKSQGYVEFAINTDTYSTTFLRTYNDDIQSAFANNGGRSWHYLNDDFTSENGDNYVIYVIYYV